jgi:hypothetical protein
MKYFLAVIFLFLFLSINLTKAQQRTIYMEPHDSGKSLVSILERFKNENPDVKILYDVNTIDATTLPRIISKLSLQRIFKDYLRNHHIVYLANDVILILKSAKHADESFKDPFILYHKRDSSSSFLLNGSVVDDNGNPIPGVSIFLPDTQIGVYTEVDGTFKIKVPNQRINTVEFRIAGYEQKRFNVVGDQHGVIRDWKVILYDEPNQLEEFVKIADRIEEQLARPASGIHQISIESIKKLPTFMGEIDPIRSLSSLPGVTSGELTSGYNVRGGDVGQNLILQEDAFIFNPSHLFGFFSAFNPDVVNNFTLYKGGGPAMHGGRVSSVLDVELKNGVKDRQHVSAGIGMISSRLAIEGPLVKGKGASYVIGGRLSYTNWLLKATNVKTLENSAANFYDLTAKVSIPIGSKDFITATVYNSYDYFRLLSDSTFDWGTTNLSTYWDHTYHDRLNSTLTISKSFYGTAIKDKLPSYTFGYTNSISSINSKLNWNYKYNDVFDFVWGGSGTLSTINLGETLENDIRKEKLPIQRSFEFAFFLETNINVSKKIGATVGIRYSMFSRNKGDVQSIYDFDNLEGRYPRVKETSTYNNASLTNFYDGFEPRLSIRYAIDDQQSIKGSYYRTYQYLHLITNTSSVTPLDYWTTSGNYLKPQFGDQYSVGYYRSISDNAFDISLEGFYKKLFNVVDYIDGVDLTMNPSLDGGILQGRGEAFGVELLLKKHIGKVTGWLSYTYSKSYRQFSDSPGNMEIINKGKRYVAAFDQPHVGSIVMSYQIGKKSTLSANFNLSSGRPITIPVSKFSYDVYLSSLIYSDRNQYRLPMYHRLDLSVNLKGRQRKRFSDEWILSIFNAYGRKNTYSIIFNRYGRAKKVSVLGSIFPSITYQFKF